MSTMATQETLLTLVEAAILAPSSHNTQPWLFGFGTTHVDVYADRRRGLAVNDPEDRELTISCGAALFNLRVAAAHTGRATTVLLLPDPDVEDLLASVRLDDGPIAIDVAELYPELARRHTHRGPLLGEPEELGPMAELLVDAARADGADLVLLEGDLRGKVVELIAEGDLRQFADRHWRRELAAWMHPRREGDGLSVSMLALTFTKAVVSAIDLGNSTSEKDQGLADHAPLLAVLTTGADTPTDWLIAGQALQRLLLTASSAGWQAGYLNQPCQVRTLRPRLKALLEGRGVPQVVLRLGRPDGEHPSTPRRPLADVFLGPPFLT